MSGIVDANDYYLWSLGATSGPGSYIYGGVKPEWIDGDFNYNGKVDSDDYGFWTNTMTTPGSNYNLGFNPMAPIVPQQVRPHCQRRRIWSWVKAGLVSSVPEPGSLVLLTLCSIGLALYRGMRTKRCIIAACLAISAILAAPQAAPAALYLNAVVDPATPGYATNVSNNGYTYTVNAANYNTRITLDIYGLIKDASPSQSRLTG